MPVIVESAWYETTWFLLLKIVAAFAVLFLAVRLRTAVIRKRQMELETEVASRTAELAKKQAELVMANEKLAELATRDPLTGIFNRRQFLAMAEEEVERTRRTRGAFTLLLIDADHFKSINDRFGHMAGDEVLRKLAERLASLLRTGDIVARYGGEELVVLLPDTNLQDGLQIAERLRGEIAAAPIAYAGHGITVTISAGAVEADGDESIDNLLRKADGALYAAKNAGRNCVIAVDA